MIYDYLENLKNYKSICPNLKTVVEWIDSHDLKNLPIGKHDIDGEQAYVTIVDTATRPDTEAVFETHNRYIDLHVVISGVEHYKVALKPLQESTPYDSSMDIAFWQATETVCGSLDNTEFVLFPAGEAHMPCVCVKGERRPIRKAIFKIEP